MEFPKPRAKSQRARRREAIQEYRRKRRAFLRAHPYCEVGETCEHTTSTLDGEPVTRRAPATDVHHTRGRGEHFLDESTWLASCRGCHDWVEAHPAEARERGYSEFRVRKVKRR